MTASLRGFSTASSYFWRTANSSWMSLIWASVLAELLWSVSSSFERSSSSSSVWGGCPNLKADGKDGTVRGNRKRFGFWRGGFKSLNSPVHCRLLNPCKDYNHVFIHTRYFTRFKHNLAPHGTVENFLSHSELRPRKKKSITMSENKLAPHSLQQKNLI